MAKVSVIIPSRAEKSENLIRTVQSVLDNATGEIEVLIGFDGLPFVTFPDDPKFNNVHTYRFNEPIGLKPMLNELAHLATGKYLFKLDAHCAVSKGFDEILKDDCQDNWVVTPRFYVLDGKTWQWQDERFYDYFYLCCPFTDPKGLRFKAGGHWPERTKERLDTLIDETPQMHGSGWFVNREFFLNQIGGFPTDDPFGHAQEPPYLGLKMWLGPWQGALMVNKKVWYAHLHQQANERGYSTSNSHTVQTYANIANYWLQNKWEQRAHDFEYFINKFPDMPSWPSNWKELYEQYLGIHS